MIRQLNYNEEFKFKNKEGVQNRISIYKDIKVFVNDENFIHNDVGPAGVGSGCLFGANLWCWNGIWVD